MTHFSTHFGRLSALTTATMMALAVGLTFTQPALAFSDDEKAQIGEIVREYLLTNPELMIDVQEELEKRQAAQADAQRSAVIESAATDLFNSPGDPVLGNPDGDVTVVEFFDYNCGFCRRAMEDMDATIAADPNVRFVLKEFPILGPESTEAHQVALAFNALMPEKYAEFHRSLMSAEGRANGESAMAIAKSLGADMDKLTLLVADPATSAPVQQTYALADALGITGTPSYVVGNELVAGALGVATLAEKIAAARENQQ